MLYENQSTRQLCRSNMKIKVPVNCVAGIWKRWFSQTTNGKNGKGSDATTKALLFLLIVVVYISCQYYEIHPLDIYNQVTFRYSSDSFSGPCILPRLNPFDPLLTKDVGAFSPITCAQIDPVVYVDENNRLQFNYTYIKENDIVETDVTCSCMDISRVNNEDETIKFEDKTECKPPFEVTCDFMKVICYYKDKKLYDNIITAVRRKKRYGLLNNDFYNVFMIGIDSLSRTVAKRQLRKTLDYMSKELNAFHFRGHVKVGANTFPNIVPLLTGRRANNWEIPPGDFVDNYPFIWKNFSQAEYVTLNAEDMPHLNAFNIAGKKGFHEIPTDHYMRPFWLAWHAERPLRDWNMGFAFKMLKNDLFKSQTEQYSLCAGDITNYVAHLKYIKQFMHTYKEERKFIFAFNTELGHYDENIINLADSDLFEFYKYIADNHRNKSIIIFFGDHGPKVSDKYVSARLDMSMPILSVILPKQLLEKYPAIAENMADNTKRLTTHFDVYATLLDIVKRRFDTPGNLIVDGNIRGLSLFGKISDKRSCREAWIPEQFCVCYQAKKVEDEKLSKKLAASVVNSINGLLKENNKCAQLTLNRIIDLQEISSGQSAKPPSSPHVIRSKLFADEYKKYTITIETMPGGGHFYAKCNLSAGSRIKVTENIERVNIYGNQSHCVNDPILKPLCMCK